MLDPLRRGVLVDDACFDQLFPSWARHLSYAHWTPVAVAARAAGWLAWKPGARVLDVGAGVGKLCLVGALVTDGHWSGVEQCSLFVHAARAAAARLALQRTRFVHGNMMALAWRSFDAFYLYNPFADSIDALAEPNGGPLGVSAHVFDAYVRFVGERLDEARAGTRVATFHGFGGEVPPSYRLDGEGEGELAGLSLWVKC